MSTFVYRIDSDKALLAAIAQMFDEAIDGVRPSSWREQVAVLLDRFGRELVIESLLESVPGLTMRHAVTMADLAEREPSGGWAMGALQPLASSRGLRK